MNTLTRRNLLKQMGALAGMATLAACSTAPAAAPANQAPAKPTSNPNAPAVTLEIGVKGEELKFDKDRLEVPAGSRVTLRLNNTSAATPHNWVLVKAGSEEGVGNDGIAAGEKNSYVKPNDPRVLALTKLAAARATVEVTFDAPPVGTYAFVCTFPGHHFLMKGIFVVK
ncbi:MAG: plastocyanin/azurin family copper-binding protein [Anaerolineae bacterium]|nr:plastocyanin/azurin family copper-binding protein [Anaerolineae bacterium]